MPSGPAGVSAGTPFRGAPPDPLRGSAPPRYSARMTMPQPASLNPNCLLCGNPIGGGCTCSQYVDVTRAGVRDPETGAWSVQLWPDFAPTPG
jgi:hypothetical protein